MPRNAAHDTRTHTERQRAWRIARAIKRMDVPGEVMADLAKLQRPGEAATVALARVLREAVERA